MDRFFVSNLNNQTQLRKVVWRIMRHPTRNTVVLILLSLLASLLAVITTPGSAQASSSYDNLLHTSPTLFVYTDGSTKSQKMDVSQSWYNDLRQAYAARIAQNIGWATNFMTELDAIRSSGGSWGVFMVENAYGNYLDVIGTRDPNATCGFVGDASTGSFQCSSHPGYGFVRAEQFAYNTYANHGCSPTWVNVCSNDGMFLNVEPVVVTNTAGYEIWGAPVSQLSNYTFYTMHFNTTYPDGYAGVVIPSSPVPTLRWAPVNVGTNAQSPISGPSGSVTVPCNSGDTDLITYDTNGQVVRNLDRNSIIDGVSNCIPSPIVDKNDDVYGVPVGGPNLVAYHGSTVKWEYPATCNSQHVVGADGNIYLLSLVSGAVHLLGLTPNMTAGQTQPSTVVDIPIQDQTDCSMRLMPYKDGIAVSGSGFSGTRFYGYSGKFLAQDTGSSDGDPVSASGQLFHRVYTAMSGGQSASVQMYDPVFDKVMWTVPVSTSGANVNTMDMYPTSNGGVVALIQEQKMDSSGVPATPTTYVTTMVVLSSNGGKGQSFQLPDTYSSGSVTGTYPLWQHQVVADTNGQITIVRPLMLSTGVNSPATVEAIDIAVYEPTSNTWPYRQIMSGDLEASGGPYGYTWYERGSGSGISEANGSLFLEAKCQSNCTDTNTKLYAFKVQGLGMDYPRGAVLTTPPLKHYVAMGDSYSSGQGAAAYNSDTTTSTNSCYKSFNAYPRVLGKDPTSALLLDNLAACGGSVTSNIDQNGTYQGVSPQDTALSGNTQVVSLTIGGNDIGFKDVIETCVKAQFYAGNCSDAIAGAEQKLQSLPGNLSRVFADILSKTSSQNGGADAQIYVLGYPPILSADAPDCIIAEFPFSGDSKSAAIKLLSDLNTAISKAVGAAGSTRIQYVDPMASNSPFLGHSLCTSAPYFNPIIPANTAESFHPNINGQGAYARLLSAYMANH